MAFRHYGGSTPSARAPWKCPSCGAENSGPLEQGCSACGAGGDAKKLDSPLAPPRGSTVPDVLADTSVEYGFHQWWEGRKDLYPDANEDLLMHVFAAGVDWMRRVLQRTAVPAPPAGRTEMDALVDVAFIDLQDPIVRATLAAALSFYIDNQLTYGAIPGQLDAEGARALLAQLQPPAEPAAGEPIDGIPPHDPDIPF